MSTLRMLISWQAPSRPSGLCKPLFPSPYIPRDTTASLALGVKSPVNVEIIDIS